MQRSGSPRTALAILGASALLGSSAAHAGPFVFASLPDTQVYAENRFPDGRNPAVTDERGTGAIFFDQTQWLVDNAASRDIRYVAHLGDIVQDGNDLDEWDRAKEAMDILLKADIPHGTVMGNHDDTNQHGPDYQRYYLQYFGPQVFEDRPWYEGSSPGGGANYQILEHEGRRIGFLNFSIDQPQAELDWAKLILERNRDTIFIIGTHRYLYDFKVAGARYGETIQVPGIGEINIEDNFVDGVVEPNNAQEFFDEFVSQHPNILMIHAGHFHAEWLRLDELNANAQTLIQILTDYQSTRNGGDGWLRIYEMDFEKGSFSFDTYSPTLGRYRTTIDHFIETIYLSYDQRNQIMEILGVEEATYFALIDGLFKDTDAPDGFLLQHPDFDEKKEQAYYQQYLDELFHGDPPERFSDPVEWEGMWLLAFAANPSDPFDFSDWVRAPRGRLDIDYDAYLETAETRAALGAIDALLSGLDTLAPQHFRRSSRLLVAHVRSARKQVERGRYDSAQRILAGRVIRGMDGCALRGKPDTIRAARQTRFDRIDDCDAQALVHPLANDALAAVETLVAVPGGDGAEPGS